MKYWLPYLRVPCFVDGSEVRFSNGVRGDLTPAQIEMVRSVFQGGVTLDDLARVFALHDPGERIDVVTERLRSAFAQATSVIGVVEVELPDKLDVILVEQGYGGVYVHSVELFRKLQARWSCLLLSPVDPLFEEEPLEGVLTLDQLRKESPDLTYFAWIQLVRTVIKLVECRLLLIMHRSQSLFLFDLLEDQRTVIYCDGFYDTAFRRVADFRIEDTPESRHDVLSEIHYLTANSSQDFFGISGGPSVNIKLLMAGAFSLNSAVENWCWGAEQHEGFAESFPTLRETIRLMLPFTDASLFDPKIVDRQERVLFTTTMHNIDKKGLPELVKALVSLRSVQVDCIVRQPERLPSIPPGVAKRMDIRSLPKDEMVQLYHRAWVNCRTSREESSPMSILEAMTCELPQIVSPAVARQIPIIEDGATGFVVDPDDPDRLAWALQTLLSDRRLRDRMGRECRRRACTLSFDARIGEFERLLS